MDRKGADRPPRSQIPEFHRFVQCRRWPAFGRPERTPGGDSRLARTWSVARCRGAASGARPGEIPQLDRAIIGAGRSQGPAVGGEGRRPGCPRVALEKVGVPGRDVPELDQCCPHRSPGSGRRARRSRPTPRLDARGRWLPLVSSSHPRAGPSGRRCRKPASSHPVKTPLRRHRAMPRECSHLSTCGNIPQLDGVVPTGRGQQLAIGGERDVRYCGSMPLERGDLLRGPTKGAVGNVPQLHDHPHPQKRASSHRGKRPVPSWHRRRSIAFSRPPGICHNPTSCSSSSWSLPEASSLPSGENASP